MNRRLVIGIVLSIGLLCLNYKPSFGVSTAYNPSACELTFFSDACIDSIFSREGIALILVNHCIPQANGNIEEITKCVFSIHLALSGQLDTQIAEGRAEAKAVVIDLNDSVEPTEAQTAFDKCVEAVDDWDDVGYSAKYNLCVDEYNKAIEENSQ